MTVQQLDTPCLIVFPETVEENIQEMIRMAGTPDRLRPHIKTHKTAEGIRMMQSAGIHSFKCATIAEGELLGMENAKDVILAHQPVGPKLERLLNLIKAYPQTHFSTITDDAESARKIGDFFSANQMVLDVYIDINAGMNRTGILPQDAFALYEMIMKTQGIQFKGLHVYDGQHRQIDFSEKERACDEAFIEVIELSNRIKEAGSDHELVAGGSPSFSVHAKRNGRNCSPGTNIFWDHCYASVCPEQHFKDALKIMTRVISKPAPNRICLDLGHKSVAGENPIDKRVFFPSHPSLKPVSQSEEHLVLEVGEHDHFNIGDLLIGIPYHVCPTVALHEYLHEVKNEQVTGRWQVVARKRKINC